MSKGRALFNSIMLAGLALFLVPSSVLAARSSAPPLQTGSLVHPYLGETTAPQPTTSQLTFVALGDSMPDAVSSLPSQGAVDVADEMGERSFGAVIHTGGVFDSHGFAPQQADVQIIKTAVPTQVT
jgi:hypothetical protein